MEQLEPGWWDRQKSKLIDAAVKALDAYANAEGPARHKIVMLSPNGNRQQIALEEGIGKLQAGSRRPVHPQVGGEGGSRRLSRQCAHDGTAGCPVAGVRWFLWRVALRVGTEYAGQRRRGVTTSGEFMR